MGQIVQVSGALAILCGFVLAQAGLLEGVWAIVSAWGLIRLTRRSADRSDRGVTSPPEA
jgi:hypothetical protein